MYMYDKHLFFCINQRNSGQACCANSNAQHFYQLTKDLIKQRKQEGCKKKIKVSQTSCLSRCSQGPVLVVYPESTWYNYENESDIREIIEKDIYNNVQVEKLLLKIPE